MFGCALGELECLSCLSAGGTGAVTQGCHLCGQQQVTPRCNALLASQAPVAILGVFSVTKLKLSNTDTAGGSTTPTMCEHSELALCGCGCKAAGFTPGGRDCIGPLCIACVLDVAMRCISIQMLLEMAILLQLPSCFVWPAVSSTATASPVRSTQSSMGEQTLYCFVVLACMLGFAAAVLPCLCGYSAGTAKSGLTAGHASAIWIATHTHASADVTPRSCRSAAPFVMCHMPSNAIDSSSIPCCVALVCAAALSEAAIQACRVPGTCLDLRKRTNHSWLAGVMSCVGGHLHWIGDSRRCCALCVSFLGG